MGNENENELSYIATVLKGFDGNAHWALIIYCAGAKKCLMYHFAEDYNNTNNPNMVFQVEDDRGVDEPDLFGRIVHQELSPDEFTKADTVLNTFGTQWNGLGNCQNFLVGALGALEESKIVYEGTQAFWKEQIGTVTSTIRERVLAARREEWEDGPLMTEARSDEQRVEGNIVDAKFQSAEEKKAARRTPRKLNPNMLRDFF